MHFFKFFRLIYIIIIFLFCQNTVYAYSQSEQVEWANKTKKDLSTIHNLIKDNGPLLELSRTTNYVMWLNEGYKQALEKSKHVSTYGGYLFTLKYYIAGFRDYHTNIMFKNLPSSSTSK